MSQLFEAGRQLPSACSANTKAVKGPDVYICELKRDVLSVYIKTIKAEWDDIYISDVYTDHLSV